jgi:6-phospho-beta-glucosidase
MKVAVIGCGLRTPLLIHGIASARPGLAVDQLSLFDTDHSRPALMAALGTYLANGSPLRIQAAQTVDEAVEDASFVISSFRPGGMEGRARDERISVEYGYAGQETTGPAGCAMALRAIPVSLEYARVVEKRAPRSWIVNFTNPAGIVTQAVSSQTGARVVGICDTPAELFHRMALGLGDSAENLEVDYFGLNHLGWVRSVRLLGEDVTPLLLQDDAMLRHLYPAELFPPAFIRTLRLIPSEYLFFYYSRSVALQNQRSTGATRGEELAYLNERIWTDLARHVEQGSAREAVDYYKAYLNRRNASYFRLEASSESALRCEDPGWNPFEGATGYHRIAVETMRALAGPKPHRIVLNVPNRGAIHELADDDVVETPCLVDQSGAHPVAAGSLPEPVRGLVIAVKAYERLVIRAALERDMALAQLALATNPIVGEWQPAARLIEAFVDQDSEYLGYLRERVASHLGI